MDMSASVGSILNATCELLDPTDPSTGCACKVGEYPIITPVRGELKTKYNLSIIGIWVLFLGGPQWGDNRISPYCKDPAGAGGAAIDAPPWTVVLRPLRFMWRITAW
jgi:hypothetical protein